MEVIFMKIDDAIRYAILFDKCICNRDAPYVKMKPESQGMPLTIMRDDGTNKTKYWNPTVEELMSNKWQIVD